MKWQWALDKDGCWVYRQPHPEGGWRRFGIVYRQQGIGRVQSRIFRSAGDTFRFHSSLDAGKAFIEAEEKACR